MDESVAKHRAAGPAPGVVAINGARLHEDVRALAQQANFAAVTTLLSDGHPQSQLTWIDTDGSNLLVNTQPFTKKYRNATRDPRVTALIIDRSDPEHYAEVRGRVTGFTEGQAAIEHADRLARRYLGSEYRGPTQRVILRIEPFRQVIRSNPWRR